MDFDEYYEATEPGRRERAFGWATVRQYGTRWCGRYSTAAASAAGVGKE